VDLLDSPFVQRTGRFIQDQYLGRLHDGLCDAQALAHPQRVLPDRSAKMGIQPHPTHGRFNFWHADPATDHGEEFKIPLPRVLGQKAGMLDDSAHVRGESTRSPPGLLPGRIRGAPNRR
jgi:hypothetical protein